MNANFIAIIILMVVIAATALIIVYFKNKTGIKVEPKKDKKTLLKEATRKLAHNPRDPSALLILADIYYNENNFEKALQTYRILLDLCATHTTLDQGLINFRYGMCAYNLNSIETAYKSLLFSWSLDKENYTLNSTLGKIEYKLKKYDKSAGLLKKCVEEKPGDIDTRKYLGLSFFKLKDYKLAYPHLAKAVEADYNDKETIFNFAKCCQKANQTDRALKLFSGLRQDPVWGPNAALFAGTINTSQRNYDDAIVDFEVGLRHKSIATDIKIEMHYRLALVFAKTGQHEESINNLKKVNTLSPNYKDVPNLLNRFKELSTNKNLGIYLNSQTPEFVNLCKNIVQVIFSKSSIKITDIVQGSSEFIEIVAEVKNKKWEDIILFKFMRTEGDVGELIIRELYARLKDTRAGRGFCFTIGSYSEGAQSFVEARLIDLVDKNKLLTYLNKVDM
ncbi:MAG: tetratricopeptide repeat protein [Spirochaetales bacterium]|nr:tetratricopeptide repeat protein [Spirochaetales bacterium]